MIMKINMSDIVNENIKPIASLYNSNWKLFGGFQIWRHDIR